MTHLAHRNFGAAIKTFSEAVQDSGGNLEAQQWLLLAKARQCLHDTGDPNAACEHYQTVLNIDEATTRPASSCAEHHAKRRLESLPFGRFFVRRADMPDNPNTPQDAKAEGQAPVPPAVDGRWPAPNRARRTPATRCGRPCPKPSRRVRAMNGILARRMQTAARVFWGWLVVA